MLLSIGCRKHPSESFRVRNERDMKLRDYSFKVVQFSGGKCLRDGRYTKATLIEYYTADIPLPDLRSHIANDCQRMMTTAGTDPCAVSYPDLLKAHLDRQRAAGTTESELSENC